MLVTLKKNSKPKPKTNRYWLEGVSETGHDENRLWMLYELLQHQLKNAGYYLIHVEPLERGLDKQPTYRSIYYHRLYNQIKVVHTKNQVLYAAHIQRKAEKRYLPSNKLEIYGTEWKSTKQKQKQK